ncbi:POZ-, AT hook-, and zinc finger-containing protein 1 [Naviculisporaceae sp. PSN 640]
MSLRDSPEHEPVGSENVETDLSESEEETAGESDTDREDDNEWSGQNGNLESLLIEAVEGDLALAAYLVPVVHHEFQLALKSKVESWQCTTTGHGSTDSSPRGKHPKGEPSRDQDGGNSRKRRRRSSPDGGGREGPSGGDGDEGDDDEDRDGDLGQTPPDGADPTPTLACPFHKRDPVKYGIQPGNSAGTKKHKYRGCIGPGYRSIQRLKEHLKRVHSPVQCDRCYEIFPGSLKERAACLAKLAEHRQMAVPCERGLASDKEGIDDRQWAILDKQSRKKNQEAHRVEKWYEIWDVLFPEPGIQRPENPWNDLTVQYPSKQSYGEESFAKLFVSMMEHKVRQKEIDANVFESIRGHLASVARQALRAHINIRGAPSTETSSSESKKLSLGSSAQLSAPATTTSHQLSATTAATSITAGSPVRGRAATNTTTSYTLSPPYHGMSIPLAQQHSQQQHSPPQFTHMSPIPQSGLGHPQVAAGNMGGFAGIATADDLNSFYAFNYTFPPPPPPHPQGHHPTSWAGAGNVPFAATHGMSPNFTGIPGAEYYGDVGDFSQTGQDEV